MIIRLDWDIIVQMSQIDSLKLDMQPNEAKYFPNGIKVTCHINGQVISSTIFYGPELYEGIMCARSKLMDQLLEANERGDETFDLWSRMKNKHQLARWQKEWEIDVNDSIKEHIKSEVSNG